MAVKTSWAAGDVLTAADLTDTFAAKADYALTQNTQTGTGASAYTFVLADASRLTLANAASAATYTIPPQASVAWVANSIIQVTSIGAGVITFAGGSGVTVTNTAATLSQYQSAALIRTGSNAWTVVPFSGGASRATYSATTGSPTITTVSGKTCIKFTGSGSITIAQGGLCDVLVVGGGGGGSYGGGGGAQALYVAGAYLPSGSLTVTVGGGGAGGAGDGAVPGSPSAVSLYFAIGGGAGGGTKGGAGGNGGGTQSGSSAGRQSLAFGFMGGDGLNLGDGGGGGASAQGGPGVSNAGGAGGAGVAYSITGSSVTYAGGGGGGNLGSGAGAGGAGGGGAGTGANGTANTGGGGGGGRAGAYGTGGSGVVIILIG